MKPTRVAVAAFVLGGALSGTAAAPLAALQDRLARAEDYLWDGDAASARRLLDEWFTRQAPTATGSERGRALLLRARLAPEPSSAERDYLEVIHAYPGSPAAPEALLRLGQWTFYHGELERSEAYFDRLVADYPTWRRRQEGRVWLARAQHALGRDRQACANAAAAALAEDPWIAALGQREASRCR